MEIFFFLKFSNCSLSRKSQWACTLWVEVHNLFSSACHRDGDGEAVLALSLLYIYIIKSVLVVLFCFVFSLFCFSRGHNWDITTASRHISLNYFSARFV